MRPFQALRMRKAGGAPLPAPRSSNSVAINLTNTCTIALPSGMVAGDSLVLYIGHSWNMTGVSWSGSHFTPSSLTGSNYNGYTLSGVVNATDIAAGSLTISFAGNGYGWVCAVALIGGVAPNYRDLGASRNGTGASSRTVTTGTGASVAPGGAVQIGDYVIEFGSAWNATAASSSSLGTTLEIYSSANVSGICRYALAAAGGNQSGTINYSGSPGGDYQSIIAVGP